MYATSEPELVRAARPFYGWRLVGVLWSLDLCNMGIPYFAGAVINAFMLSRIPMARSTFGLGFTLLNLFVGLPCWRLRVLSNGAASAGRSCSGARSYLPVHSGSRL